MAGHSKWSQIKRKKAVKDQEKGLIFSKLSRLITLAVIEGGGITDPNINFRLRLAVDKAKESNMPKDNIQRAIEKGTGPDKAQLKEMMYEAFGPGGIAMLIHSTTDNSNRTLIEIRGVLDKNGGKLVSRGAVSYLFEKCAIISFDKTSSSEDKVFEFAQKVSALDIDQDENSFTVYFPFDELGKTRDRLGDLIPTVQPELDFKPKNMVKIEEEPVAKKILSLIETLEGLDDVQKVYANFDIPDKFLNI